MLLIDGVKYKEWTPLNEDAFEQAVKEHTQEIFGEQSIYLDRKQKLTSLSGIGSIPDGYGIVFGDSPEWHIVEVELSSHPLHDHIVSQVSRFITGISNPNIQRGIVNAIDSEIKRDDFLKLRLRKAIEPTEIYKFLSDLISKPPILTVIIEKETQELREAISTLAHPQIKVVEFQTFTREGTEGLAVHAHLFEPLYAVSPPPKKPEEVIKTRPPVIRKQKRVTVKNLLDTDIVKVGQEIYRIHKGQRFEGKIMADGSIELSHNGRKFNSLSAAATGVTDTSEDGWTKWYTRKEGVEYLMDELRKEYNGKFPA